MLKISTFLLFLFVFSALHVAAQTKEKVGKATITRVKWTWKLPPAVRRGWKECKYADWEIQDIKKIVRPADTVYTLHVIKMQSLGPDDADLESEYVLYFSTAGQLVKEERRL